jgi:hypothetical protein
MGGIDEETENFNMFYTGNAAYNKRKCPVMGAESDNGTYKVTGYVLPDVLPARQNCCLFAQG